MNCDDPTLASAASDHITAFLGKTHNTASGGLSGEVLGGSSKTGNYTVYFGISVGVVLRKGISWMDGLRPMYYYKETPSENRGNLLLRVSEPVLVVT